MFNKVLIAEDQQIFSKGLKGMLKDHDIDNVQTTDCCDNALLKIRASLAKKEPFDLLITDLSFRESHSLKDISSGTNLIRNVKKIQPNIKIIVFSVEIRVGKIKKLQSEYNIDAYVCKGKRESEDMSKAISNISGGKKYFSEAIRLLLRNTETISNITATDKLILELLASGMKQYKIPEHFQNNNIPSGGKRTIEDRIKNLKIMFNAKTIPQLIAIAKDIGLI